MTATRRISTPLGTVFAAASTAGLTSLTLGKAPPEASPGSPEAEAVLDTLEAELRAYFDRTRTAFSVPLAPEGTPFQQRVWSELRAIPHGQTRSYADVAARVGSPDGARAVGLANARNPIAILIPCHRVVAADGTLHGYAYGLDVKARLLEIEGAGLFSPSAMLGT